MTTKTTTIVTISTDPERVCDRIIGMVENSVDRDRYVAIYRDEAVRRLERDLTVNEPVLETRTNREAARWSGHVLAPDLIHVPADAPTEIVDIAIAADEDARRAVLTAWARDLLAGIRSDHEDGNWDADETPDQLAARGANVARAEIREDGSVYLWTVYEDDPERYEGHDLSDADLVALAQWLANDSGVEIR